MKSHALQTAISGRSFDFVGERSAVLSAVADAGHSPSTPPKYAAEATPARYVTGPVQRSARVAYAAGAMRVCLRVQLGYAVAHDKHSVRELGLAALCNATISKQRAANSF